MDEAKISKIIDMIDFLIKHTELSDPDDEVELSTLAEIKEVVNKLYWDKGNNNHHKQERDEHE